MFVFVVVVGAEEICVCSDEQSAVRRCAIHSPQPTAHNIPIYIHGYIYVCICTVVVDGISLIGFFCICVERRASTKFLLGSHTHIHSKYSWASKVQTRKKNIVCADSAEQRKLLFAAMVSFLINAWSLVYARIHCRRWFDFRRTNIIILNWCNIFYNNTTFRLFCDYFSCI